MSTQSQQLFLTPLADWIRRTDDHVAHRLALLEEAERVLAEPEAVSPEDRARLSERLERWRYQHLNKRRGRLGPEDRQLAEALDWAANRLAGRASRAPRAARAAISDSGADDSALAAAAACLDPAVPLEEVTRRAREITDRHFGRLAPDEPDTTGQGRDAAAPRRRMALYAPLYLSSFCTNYCAYCGFRFPHSIRRKHLTHEQAVREAAALNGRGFRHILLVAGDFPSLTTVEYYAGILRTLSARGVQPTVEVAPQSTRAYAALARAGARGVTLYQETYLEDLYQRYHARGSKAAFDWRLEGLERAAEAGMARLGLGVLLGLADPRQDVVRLMRHGRYLASRFPDRTIAFSLPRIREAPDGFQPPYPVDDETLVRLYCGLRVAFPRAELVLSTREPAALRNRLAALCITQMSAGSCTTPGGYEDAATAEELGRQFPVCDRRSPAEVAAWLRGAGFEVAWDLAPQTAVG